MLYIILICFSAILGGCSLSFPEDCKGQFDYHAADFTVEQQQWIEHSAQRWNDWVGHTVVSVKPGERNICDIHAGTTVNPKAVGEEYEPGASITIDLNHEQKVKYLDQAHFESVVMHELGHAMGYEHIKNGIALMAITGALDFTYLDRAECIQLGMCND